MFEPSSVASVVVVLVGLALLVLSVFEGIAAWRATRTVARPAGCAERLNGS